MTHAGGDRRPQGDPTTPAARISDRAFAALQNLIPQHLLSRVIYHATRAGWRRWQQGLIRWFIRRYRVDMDAALSPDPRAYPHFNAFFTRALKPGVRPLADGETTVVSPVDGRVYQADYASYDRLIQAKGLDYTLDALLGGDAGLAAAFYGGPFLTLYLSPRDYHRIHMPVAGRLRMMRYVPGRLFSVSAGTTRAVPNLFARNERLVALFDSPAGPMAMVLVGALFVSAMETVWSNGVIRSPNGRRAHTWHYPAGGEPVLQRGEEMGRFNMGSTVIVLFNRGRVAWDGAITSGREIWMGQAVGAAV